MAIILIYSRISPVNWDIEIPFLQNKNSFYFVLKAERDPFEQFLAYLLHAKFESFFNSCNPPFRVHDMKIGPALRAQKQADPNSSIS